MKLKPKDIIKLLQDNTDIKSVISSFHARLAAHNKDRQLGKNRTLLEKTTDALGRLLTGNETCAAVAVDRNKICVATNRTGHSKHKLILDLKTITIMSGSTSDIIKLKLKIDFKLNHKCFTRESPVIEYNHTTISSLNESNIESYLEELSDRLTPKNKDIRFTFPFNSEDGYAHGIEEYPYPIDINISLADLPGLSLDRVQTEDSEIPTNNFTLMSFSLDPLQRRTEAIFHHLGLIALHNLKGRPPLKYDFTATLNRSRIRLLNQTLVWEAPKLIGERYAETLNEYVAPLSIDEQTLLKKSVDVTNKKEQKSRLALQEKIKSWEEKKKQITELTDFIEKLAYNLFLSLQIRKSIASQHLQRSSLKCSFSKEKAELQITKALQHAINQHIDRIMTQIEHGKLPMLPNFLKKDIKSARKILEKAKQYFFDILRVESFFEHIVNPDFAKILASIGILNTIKEDPDKLKEFNDFLITDAEIILVDDLIDLAHAEMRLFKYLMADKRLQNRESLPYFGITMLCCPNCHLFLQAHGVDFVEGSRFRAGGHGSHFAEWVFDVSAFSDEHIKNFLGEEIYKKYKGLEGLVTYRDGQGKKYQQSKQAWVWDIIQELGGLNSDELKSLGFQNEKIWTQGSNYAEDVRNEEEWVSYGMQRVSTRYRYEPAEMSRILSCMVNGHQKSPSSPCVVLDPIDNISDNSLYELLGEHQKKRGTLLIPFNLGQLHWVGLAIEYDETERLIRADYYDPLGDNVPPFLNLILEKFHRGQNSTFYRVTPEQNLICSDTAVDSGPCTISNLLCAIGFIECSVTSSDRRLTHLQYLEKAGDSYFYQDFYHRQASSLSSLHAFAQDISIPSPELETIYLSISELKTLLIVALNILELSTEKQNQLKELLNSETTILDLEKKLRKALTPYVLMPKMSYIIEKLFGLPTNLEEERLRISLDQLLFLRKCFTWRSGKIEEVLKNLIAIEKEGLLLSILEYRRKVRNYTPGFFNTYYKQLVTEYRSEDTFIQNEYDCQYGMICV